MVPAIPPITLLLVAQCINGVLLPVLLIAIVKLINNPAIMGEYRNSITFNILAIGTTAIVSILSLLLIGKTIADMF
jgi:Mn2+/Fe2+ NRAMP family transporter